jgi:transcriptional antiterminator
MQQNEYLTVKEISLKYDMSARNVRRIIGKLNEKYSEASLHKNKKNEWQIHYLLVPKFKPQRTRKNKYFALSIDPCANYSESDINVVMRFVYEQMNDDSLELNYVIEQKKSNNQNHLHCFIKCSDKKKLLDLFKLGFSRISYHESKIFDLVGWKGYITKDGSLIKRLKN